jgi:hypothetical protein
VLILMQYESNDDARSGLQFVFSKRFSCFANYLALEGLKILYH